MSCCRTNITWRDFDNEYEEKGVSRKLSICRSVTLLISVYILNDWPADIMYTRAYCEPAYCAIYQVRPRSRSRSTVPSQTRFLVDRNRIYNFQYTSVTPQFRMQYHYTCIIHVLYNTNIDITLIQPKLDEENRNC